VSDDAKFDELIDREARGYRSGGVPPADRMWSRIERDVSTAIRRPRLHVTRHWPWLAAGAGIAAALVIGIAIGRGSMRYDAGTPAIAGVTPSGAATDSARGAQMRAVTWSHLAQAEAFLTEVRADLKTGRRDPERGDRSRHLLARTRLIMANGAAPAPSVERLLEDLELVLAEISALPDSGMRRSIDARLLNERLSAGTVLPRIRTILPSPPAIGGS
jgi:hypothetical protein